jgi:hypothetical protein
MIEDALKRARQAYFLVLAIVAVTVLFSISIKLPTKIVQKQQLIEKIVSIDLSAYDEFAKEQIDIQIARDSNQVLRKLRELKSSISGVDKIRTAFQNLDYSGRLFIKWTDYNNLSHHTLSNINNINELPISKDIKWFIPDLKEIEKAVISHIITYDQVGLRVSDVEISGDRDEYSESTFEAFDEKPVINLTFNLTSADSSNPIARFTKDFSGNVITLNNTSLTSWVEQELKNNDVLYIEKDSLKWNLPLEDFSLSESQLDFLGILKNLEGQIESFSPNNQEISFLGLKIKGSFVFTASPLLMIVLMYFLLSNLTHLSSLVDKHHEEFKQFSWTALNGKGYRKIEIRSVVFIAPIIGFSSLVYGLIQFADFKSFLPALTILSLFGSLVIGVKVTQKFDYLHTELKKTTSK